MWCVTETVNDPAMEMEVDLMRAIRNPATENSTRCPPLIGFLAAVWLLAPEAVASPRYSVGVSLRGSPVWVPAVYETRAVTRIIPAVYEERPHRIWQEPVYEILPVRIEIPAEVVARRVPRYDSKGRIVGYRLVDEVIRPARTIFKQERVLRRPGRYETVLKTVMVRPERTETVFEKTLITPGHWVYPRYFTSRYGHHTAKDRYNRGDPDRPRRVRTRD
jgi:hypothetical protein